MQMTTQGGVSSRSYHNGSRVGESDLQGES
jgi:hypothetical protein